MPSNAPVPHDATPPTYTKEPSGAPVLTVTMGDPAGVGPEVLLKALAAVDRQGWPQLRVYGDRPHLDGIAARFGLARPSDYPDIVWCDCPIVPESVESDAYVYEKSVVSDARPRASFPMGQLTAQGARAQVTYIEQALGAITRGEAHGVVTAPIHKQALATCALPYHGHTEWLADVAGTDVTMMLAGPKLRAVPATVHIALADVPGALTTELILQSIAHTDQTLRRWFGIASPRIAVCGLNPHAGDGGMMGHEDDEVVAPAIKAAQQQGFQATGPWPGDTVFYFAYQGEFDAVVAMYHDQALAPLKLVHFDDAINLTMGLPFVRTSVDHGTAYDIAATGTASPTSMIEALRTGATMVQRAAQTRQSHP